MSTKYPGFNYETAHPMLLDARGWREWREQFFKREGARHQGLRGEPGTQQYFIGATLVAERYPRSTERPARCPDCGEPGERQGHMSCQYPGRSGAP